MSNTVLHAETPTPRSMGENQRWEPPTPAELQAMLSDYTVERLVGRGGMGAVYQVRQISLNRPVALKIIADDLGNFDDFDETEANYVERFKNEARAMARVSHPGIVAVYDFGETKVGRFVPAAPSGERRAEDSPPYQSPPHHGLLYIAMEYIEGTDVARMLEQQERLQPKHALAITAQVCAALSCAHERGIIHRDIKPANILIDPDDVVKVADFGLAKMHGSDVQTLGLTQSGIAMGTLHYMAPESLILGTAVDHRADIYAVGVMLYQMITGKVPHGMFKPPSTQVPGLDPRYDAMITKALRADRDRRYQSIQELHRDLCDILTGGTLKVEPAAAPAPAPAAVPKQTLQQALAGLKSRLSPLLAKVRPFMRSLSAGGTVMLMVALVVVTIALFGYAAITMAEKIWPHQSPETQSVSKPTLATAPATPVQAPIVPPQPAPSAPAPTPAAKAAAPPAAVSTPAPVASITPAASKYLAWMDDKAQVITAEFVRLTGDKVVLKNQANGEMTFALNRLSSASQKLAQQLAQTNPSAPLPPVATPSPAPAVMPITSAATSPLAPVLKNDARLARLEADFDKFWQEEMQQPYLAELKDLRKRYVDLGLTPARDEAMKSGRQNELSALNAEIVLVYSGAKIPAANAGNASASLVTLRRLYHQRLSEYVAGRVAMTPPVIRAQLKGFDAYINELKKAGRQEEAQRVQTVRDSKAELKLK